MNAAEEGFGYRRLTMESERQRERPLPGGGLAIERID